MDIKEENISCSELNLEAICSFLIQVQGFLLDLIKVVNHTERKPQKDRLCKYATRRYANAVNFF